MKRKFITINKYIIMIEKEFISLQKFNGINNLCNAIKNLLVLIQNLSFGTQQKMEPSNQEICFYIQGRKFISFVKRDTSLM